MSASALGVIAIAGAVVALSGCSKDTPEVPTPDAAPSVDLSAKREAQQIRAELSVAEKQFEAAPATSAEALATARAELARLNAELAKTTDERSLRRLKSSIRFEQAKLDSLTRPAPSASARRDAGSER